MTTAKPKKKKPGTHGPQTKEEERDGVVVTEEITDKKPKLKGTSTPAKRFTRSQAI